MGDTLSRSLARHQRERDYARRQGQRFLTRSRWSPGVGVVDVTDLYFAEAQDVKVHDLNLGGKGSLFGPERTDHRPDEYHAPSMAVAPARLDQAIRLMGAADATRLRRISERMAKLQHERRELLEAAFDRALVIDEPSLRATLTKKRRDAERGYQRDARPLRVKGHRRA